MIKFLNLNKQYLEIKNEIDEAVQKVIYESAFIGGKYVQKFEDQFASYLKVKYCIGVGNGTDALEIAIEALDLPPKSEIIVPANTFIATAEAVTRTGHIVKFCDCNEQSFTISTKSLKNTITSKTKAVIPVHLYGHPCDMDKINEIALQFNLKVIEDCAQAHGAEYKGQKVGTLSDVATFSFYPGKNLGAYGDAGAIVTNNKNLALKCRMIGNHGRTTKHDHIFEGRNSRLDGIQAAILTVKLKHLNEWTTKRRYNADFYNKKLAKITEITLPYKAKNVKHVYHLFVIRAEKRNELQDFLYTEGIDTGIHYPTALPKLKAYKYLQSPLKDIFTASKIDSEILSLPVGDNLDNKALHYIEKKIKEFYK